MKVIRFYNNASQSFTATATPLQLVGTKTVDTGCGANACGNAITLNKSGVYHISADVTFTAAVGNVTLQIYENGVALPEAIATITTAASTNYTVHVETDVQQFCTCAGHNNITVVIGGAVGTVSHLSGGVWKGGC